MTLEGFSKERTLPETNIYKRDMSKFCNREFEENVVNAVSWGELIGLRRLQRARRMKPDLCASYGDITL